MQRQLLYNDYSSSLPSWRNALTELTWSLNHYKEIRKKVVPIFQGKLMLMEGLHSNIHDFIEAREVMRMETKQGVFAFLRLQYLLTKNYKKLFHTSGGGPISYFVLCFILSCSCICTTKIRAITLLAMKVIETLL